MARLNATPLLLDGVGPETNKVLKSENIMTLNELLEYNGTHPKIQKLKARLEAMLPHILGKTS